MACCSVSALKNTQANVVKLKVINIPNRSLIEGKPFPLATISKFCLFLLKSNKGKKYNACKKPQMIKVQLAPCQNPLTTKMTNTFRTFNKVPPLLPPKGIYT